MQTISAPSMCMGRSALQRTSRKVIELQWPSSWPSNTSTALRLFESSSPGAGTCVLDDEVDCTAAALVTEDLPPREREAEVGFCMTSVHHRKESSRARRQHIS